MTIMKRVLGASTTTPLQTLVEKSAVPLLSHSSDDVDYEDGGNLAERLRASGMWHLIPDGMRAGMTQVRAVFRVDLKTGAHCRAPFHDREGDKDLLA